MVKIRNVKLGDVDKIAELVALDHNADREKGFFEAIQHKLDHLESVPKHCYVVEGDNKEIVGAMVLHPQEKVFEIEDFHVKQIEKNKEALLLLSETAGVFGIHQH